jgi:predicted amidophosphoribosyltransferase
MKTSLLDRVVSLVVPPLCLACREPELSGDAVCPPCRGGLVPLVDPRCGRCGAPVVAPMPRCPECRGRALGFHSAWAPFAYEGTARRLVSALKSRGATRAAAVMGSEVARRAPPGLLHGALVPVPAHPGRRRGAGFNQAAWIAGAIGAIAGLPVADVLARRGGPPQVGLARRDRIANARGSVRAGRPPRAARVVLVDDVYTTGATLDACGRALAGAGVRDIVAVTFARTTR